MEGKIIEASVDQGWAWDQLDELADEHRGGSPRAERDALRLLAVLLDNWDTNAHNQRLMCLPEGLPKRAKDACTRPFAYMSDVGATFGGGKVPEEERKLSVEAWAEVPIWADVESCHVRIRSPWFEGPTFGKASISEPGRRFLGGLLAQLSAQQIRDLFEGSGFVSQRRADAANSDPENWVRAFQNKVRQIVDRPPCPPL
jgi:hypothetical protein